MSLSSPLLLRLLLALVCAGGIAWAARRVRALSRSGAWAAAGVGFCCFGFGGWPGALALLLFFVSSTALGRVGRRKKEALAFEKGGERDAGQVLANGGIAAACAALYALFPSHAPLAAAAFLGALAEANADTWATELGALAKGRPRLITTFRPAPPGASGAISIPGTLAALSGAILLAAVAPLFALPTTPRALVAVTAGGFAGALFDSLLGATAQAQYRCPVCGALTERRVHCADGAPAVRERGIAGLGNDAVNALATVVGAVVAALLTGT